MDCDEEIIFMEEIDRPYDLNDYARIAHAYVNLTVDGKGYYYLMGRYAKFWLQIKPGWIHVVLNPDGSLAQPIAMMEPSNLAIWAC